MNIEKRRAEIAARKAEIRKLIEGDSEKGKITIAYFSKEDLTNIYEAILGEES